MGWETNVPAMITFSKETYQDEHQVRNEIEDLKERIAEYKEDLVIFAMGNPKDFVEKDEPVMALKTTVKDTVEWLEECTIKLYKLELLLENFKCRGGDFVENPDYEKSIEEWMEKSYINGNIKYYNNQKEENDKEK